MEWHENSLGWPRGAVMNNYHETSDADTELLFIGAWGRDPPHLFTTAVDSTHAVPVEPGSLRQFCEVGTKATTDNSILEPSIPLTTSSNDWNDIESPSSTSRWHSPSSCYSASTEASDSIVSPIPSLSSTTSSKDSNDAVYSASTSGQWLEVPGKKRKNASDTSTLGSKRRSDIICRAEGCEQSFTKAGDLKRHQNSIHLGKVPGCGCCKNQGREAKRLRRDKLREHLIKEHGWSKDQSLYTCEELQCQELLFASKFCLSVHRRNDHSVGSTTLLPIRLESNVIVSDCGCLKAAGLLNAYPNAGTTSFSEGNLASINEHFYNPYSSTDAQICWPNAIEEASGLPWSDLPTSRSFRFVGLEHLSFPLPLIPSSMPSPPYSEKSISSVQPIEFAILSAQSLFEDIQRVLYLDARVSDRKCVTYDMTAMRLTLRGAKERMPQATKMFERMRKWLRNEQKDESRPDSSIAKSHISSSPSWHNRNSALSRAPTCGKDMKIFAFNARDHPDHYVTWMEVIMPELPGVLDKLLGYKYSASLVNFGQQRRDAEPYIQIETQRPFDETVKDRVRKRIHTICSTHSRPSIPIFFAQGSYVNLACHESTDFQGEDDGECEFSYNSPWLCPGMGAPIGMKCSDEVSGTLGGYLEIDGDNYAVSAGHVVEDARRNLNSNFELSDKFALVSPPQNVIRSLREWLDKRKVEIEGAVEEDMALKARDNQRISGSEEITPEELAQGSTRDLQKLLQARQILQQGPQVIGKYSISKDTLKASGTLRRVLSREPGSRDKVRMDWAVHKALVRGSNRHRFNSAEKARAAYPLGSADDEGQICHETCDPSSDDDVHYVGASTRHRKLKASIAPTWVKDDKYEGFWAYFIVEPGQSINVQHYEGDSGTWILRSSDNKVLGKLYGAINGKLLYTPINDIIDHIKEELDAKEVHLPRNFGGPSPPLPQVQRLSRTRQSFTVLKPSKCSLSTPPLTPESSCASETPFPNPLSPFALNPRPDSIGPPTPSFIELEQSCELVERNTSKPGIFEELDKDCTCERIAFREKPCKDLVTVCQTTEYASKGTVDWKISDVQSHLSNAQQLVPQRSDVPDSGPQIESPLPVKAIDRASLACSITNNSFAIGFALGLGPIKKRSTLNSLPSFDRQIKARAPRVKTF